MSFNIFSSGAPVFNYSRDNCAAGEVFEATAVINAIRQLQPNPQGVGEAIVDYLGPSAEGTGRAEAQRMGLHIHARCVREAVNYLGTCNNAYGGRIFVSAYQRTLCMGWTGPQYADPGSSVTHTFTSNQNDGSQFLNRVIPALAERGLNNYGVLREMCEAIQRYGVYIHTDANHCRATPTLLITLRH